MSGNSKSTSCTFGPVRGARSEGPRQRNFLSYIPQDEITASPPFPPEAKWHLNQIRNSRRTRPSPPRRDWAVEKHIAFIEALAETGIVEEACRRVGMFRTSVDNLRRRHSGIDFRRAWEIAVDYGLYRVEEDAITGSRRGVARPIFYKGEQLGEWCHQE